MKRKKTTLLIAALFSVLFTIAANPISVGSINAEPLDESEIHHLKFIREEEKLAHDVYTVLYEQWEMQVFDNIAQSEQRHTDAMGRLLAYFGLEDPLIDQLGVFEDDYIQTLFDDLTAWGLQSKEDALLVGAFIEEYDILDIWLAHNETDEIRIQEIYVNLYEGSYNHLDAFIYNFEKLTAGVYSLQLMTPEEYSLITETQAHQNHGGN